MTSIEAPKSCPSCSATLYREKDQLFCPNNIDCPAQSQGKIINFCKKLKIKGFGQATLNTLGFAQVRDLLYMSPELGVEHGLSEHMATKLTKVLQDRLNQGIDYRDFIGAMSIPLIGDSASSKLQVSSIDDITYEVCKKCGLGDKASSNLVEWVELEWPILKQEGFNDFITYNNKIQKAESNGVTVVITGKLNDFKNRTEAKKYLESLGFSVKSSVTKNTDYLICEDGTTGSSYKKATSLNIPITTIKSLEDNK
jgi:DNA ligase (NAD+)